MVYGPVAGSVLVAVDIWNPIKVGRKGLLPPAAEGYTESRRKFWRHERREAQMPWYAQLSGQLFGPYDDAQFKAFATEGRITLETQVSQSSDGPWVAAARVKGLFPGAVSATTGAAVLTADHLATGSASAAILDKQTQVAEHLESISHALTQIVTRVVSAGNENGQASHSSRTMQYKVLTQKDKWFSGKFDPEKLEGAINSYAAQGWRVRGVATASFPGFGGNRDEMVVVMERES